MEYVLIYVGVGLVAGFLAGLFGVGGGLIIVPALSLTFAAQHFPASFILHLALGTSLTSIVFTSISSVFAHHKHQAIRWDIVRKITPSIIIGALLGTLIAARVSSHALTVFFIIFLAYAGTQMLLDVKTKPSRELPNLPVLSLVGSGVGVISSLVGIGGGTLSVPFLAWHNVNLHRAIATSAAIGVPIALSGALGYLVNGLSVSGLPRLSVGFIYLPALVCIVASSIMTAPIGARLAHKIPVALLKKTFSLLLYAIGGRMAYGLI